MRQIVFCQPGSQGRRNCPAPIGRSHKNHRVWFRIAGARKQTGMIPRLYFLFDLIEQLCECHGIRLPRINFAPVTACQIMNFLRNPMRMAGIRVRYNQRAAYRVCIRIPRDFMIHSLIALLRLTYSTIAFSFETSSYLMIPFYGFFFLTMSVAIWKHNRPGKQTSPSWPDNPDKTAGLARKNPGIRTGCAPACR